MGALLRRQFMARKLWGKRYGMFGVGASHFICNYYIAGYTGVYVITGSQVSLLEWFQYV